MLQDSEDGVPMLLTIVCHSMMLLDAWMPVAGECLYTACLVLPMLSGVYAEWDEDAEPGEHASTEDGVIGLSSY